MTVFELITWALGTTISLCTIAGLAVKFVLLPYVKEHIVAPVRQTEKQVSENHHSNEEPTVLDKIADVSDKVEGIRQEVQVVARIHEGHLNWSDKWTRRIEADLETIKKRTTKKKGLFR